MITPTKVKRRSGIGSAFVCIRPYFSAFLRFSLHSSVFICIRQGLRGKIRSVYSEKKAKKRSSRKEGAKKEKVRTETDGKKITPSAGKANRGYPIVNKKKIISSASHKIYNCYRSRRSNPEARSVSLLGLSAGRNGQSGIYPTFPSIRPVRKWRHNNRF